MIEFMSNWVKGLGLAIVIVSILEMLLPNNKTKKYIRMVMGVYILFTIVSPFVSNLEIFDINQINLEEYKTTETSTSVNQSSMDERIQELYIQELEKDIIKKLKEKEYEVTNCKIQAKILQEEMSITKIKISVQKSKKDNDDQNLEKKENLENQIVTEIQKIKPIDTSIKKDDSKQKEEESIDTKVNKSDVQNIKKFLIEEYGVNEKCLEIN